MRFFSIFALVAVLEMATFFWVQSWIGLGWALALALLTALIGSVLVKRAGVAVIRRFRQKVDSSQVPGRELSDGASVLVSGAFLISPGFITDILGFLLLVPTVQTWIYRNVTKRISSRIKVVRVGTSRLIGDVIDGRRSGGSVIDVEEVD